MKLADYLNDNGMTATEFAVLVGRAPSTISRILTGMRAKGFVNEFDHPTDRRRRIFKLTDSYLAKGDDDIAMLLGWCVEPNNALI